MPVASLRCRMLKPVMFFLGTPAAARIILNVAHVALVNLLHYLVPSLFRGLEVC